MMQSDSMHSEIVVPWMPKLQYRAKSGEHPDSVVSVDAISPVSSTFSSSLASTTPSTPPSSERCPSPNSSLPPYRKHRQRLMASSSSHHLSHNPNDNAAERKPLKKRASSFFNFFSVKEPSQQALEDYQRQLRITGGANSKDGRFDTVGLSGISSAKLPSTVPKVNSKWDGVPHQLTKEKEKEKEKQKRNAHLHFHDYTRSLRSSGSERSGSTNTSSPTLSRSSSHYHDPSFSSFPLAAAAGGPPPFHKSGSSTLSDLYGWEKTGNGSNSISSGGDADGDGTHPGGGKKVKDRSKQKLSRKTSSYLQAPPPPVPRSIPDKYLEPDLSDLGALLGPPTDQSSSPSPDLDKPPGSSLSGEGLIAPPGHSSTNASNIKTSTTSSSPSSSSRTTPSPSPPPVPEQNEMMIHPTIIDQAIAPWVHSRYQPSPAAVPAHQKQKKKSMRGIFSGK